MILKGLGNQSKIKTQKMKPKTFTVKALRPKVQKVSETKNSNGLNWRRKMDDRKEREREERDYGDDEDDDKNKDKGGPKYSDESKESKKMNVHKTSFRKS